MSRQVFVQITDFPRLPDVLVVELEGAVVTYANLILKLYTSWCHILTVAPSDAWEVHFDGRSIKDDTFTTALESHSRLNPITVRVHSNEIVPAQINGDLMVRRQHRRLNRHIRVGGTANREVTYTTPYNHNINFGHYVPQREGFPMDYQIIDLKDFEPRFQTEFGARLVAFFYAVLFYGAPIGINDDLQHSLHSVGSGVSFAKSVHRADVENSVNIDYGLTQQGKGIEITICAIFNLFLGKDSLVYVRDINGNAAKIDFKINLINLSRQFVNYCETVLLLDIDYYGDMLSSITVYEGTTVRPDRIQRPFIYCERLNPSKIAQPFTKIYQQGGANMYSLFIDEEDEKRMSVDAKSGKCEDTLYNKMQDAIDGSVYYHAFMTTSFTATPAPR